MKRVPFTPTLLAVSTLFTVSTSAHIYRFIVSRIKFDLTGFNIPSKHVHVFFYWSSGISKLANYVLEKFKLFTGYGISRESISKF